MKKRSLPQIILPVVVGAAFAFVPLVSGATTSVIVNETFANGTRDTQYRNPQTGTYESLKWYSSTWTANSALTTTTGSMTIHTEITNGTKASRHAVSQFDSLNMGVGDSVALSFNASFTGIRSTSTSENAFYFGLYDSNGTTYTADNQNPTTTAVGYNGRIRPYEVVGEDSQSRSYLGYRQFVDPATAPLLTSVGPKTFTSQTLFSQLENNTNYFFNMTMTLNSASEMLVLLLILDGSNQEILRQSITVNDPNVFTSFDTIAFSAYDTAAGIGIDTVTLSNIMLTHTQIPESGTVALLLGSVMAVLVAGRARRLRRRG